MRDFKSQLEQVEGYTALGMTQHETAYTWLKNNPCHDHAESHYCFARCCAALHQPDEAKQQLGLAFEITPEFKLRALDDPAFSGIW